MLVCLLNTVSYLTNPLVCDYWQQIHVQAL